MAAIPDTVKTECCAPWTNYDQVAVFSAASTTGDNEASGGNYTRKQTVYTADNAGINTGTEVNIPVAAGTYPETGIFDANTGGNFGGAVAFNDGPVNVSGINGSIDVTMSLEIQ